MIGLTVSHYRIVGQIGAGGMGVVYAAEDTRLRRSVALKFVPEDLAIDDQAIERLRSEARTASALNHANICTIYDIGEHEGRPFIVMELLKGQTLRERLGAGRLKIHEVVDIGIQVADALDSAHRSDVIHRDIKPANLFLTDRGQVKILDFGLAKLLSPPSPTNSTGPTRDLTADGVTLGTVSYMSPEQVTGEQLDRRTDLFSLGVVLYECLTGRQPFTGKTSAVVFLAILNRAPVAPIVFNPDVPLRLQDVVHNCLEKDRELRCQDAAGLRADLRRIKRDLESGRSGVMKVVPIDETGPDGAIGDAQVTQRVSPAVTSPQNSSGRAKIPPVGPSTYLVLMVVGALVVVALYLVPWLVRTPPEGATPARVEAPVVRSQLDLAAKSLEERNYRAARAYSEDVLRAVPNDPEAVRIHDAAGAMIKRFEEALTRATERLAAGDTDGATRALDVARGIDPAAPAVSDLSARLVAQLLKLQGDAQRRETPQSGGTSAAQRATSESAQSGGRPPAEPPQTTKTPPPTVLPSPAPAQVPVAAAPPPPAGPPAVSSGPPPIATPAPTSVRPVSPEPDPPPVQQQTTPPVDRPAPVPPRIVEDDDAAIGRVLETYRRAIESKDMALLRSVKPNLSAQEQRGIEAALRDMRSLQVTLSNVSIERRGDEASVRLRRRDSILAGGRRQTTESQQIMTLVRNGGTWVIRDFGR